MAATPGRKYGALTGTTAVTAVSAPAANIQRIIKTIVVYNRDTVSHTFGFFIDDNGTPYQYDKAVVGAGQRYTDPDVHVLDSTTDTIEIDSDAAATTTEPTYFTTHVDVP